MIMARHLYLNIFLLCALIQGAHAQINAINPDTTLDRYYINLPIDVTQDAYMTGDTVVAVYNTPPNGWSNAYKLVFQKYPDAKPKPLHVVRAVVSDVKSSKGTRHIIGLKLKIFSIERHYNGTIEMLDEYRTPYRDCLLKAGGEQWRDTYDWQNISGFYKIQKSTDNYKIGDTVHRIYHADKSLLGEIFSPGRYKTYELNAAVIDIDTTAAQTLLLHFLTIKLKYYRANFINPSKSHDVIEFPERMKYNYQDVVIGDRIWTKPYLWFCKGQNTAATYSKNIPSSISFYRGCSFRILSYDCNGNEFSLDYSQRN